MGLRPQAGSELGYRVCDGEVWMFRYWLKSSLLILVLPLAMTACGPKNAKQESCGFVQNVYGQRVSWKGDLPVKFYLHESVPVEFQESIKRSMREWERVTGKRLFELVGSGIQGQNVPKQDGINVIYWMTNWEDNKTAEQARTSVYWVSDTIKEADIRVNDKNFNFYRDYAEGYNDVHVESLMIHELGHVLGLKHNDESESVMATYLASQTVRNEISAADLESVQCEY